MSDRFAKPSDFRGSGYFKPKDYMGTALALLIEPKRIDRNVPNTYKGKTRDRDAFYRLPLPHRDGGNVGSSHAANDSRCATSGTPVSRRPAVP